MPKVIFFFFLTLLSSYSQDFSDSEKVAKHLSSVNVFNQEAKKLYESFQSLLIKKKSLEKEMLKYEGKVADFLNKVEESSLDEKRKNREELMKLYNNYYDQKTRFHYLYYESKILVQTRMESMSSLVKAEVISDKYYLEKFNSELKSQKNYEDYLKRKKEREKKYGAIDKVKLFFNVKVEEDSVPEQFREQFELRDIPVIKYTNDYFQEGDEWVKKTGPIYHELKDFYLINLEEAVGDFYELFSFDN